jgi:ribosomal protein S18 acetylase RimI-like enzyme
MLRTTIIRAFDGSLADAEGLLAVEKATFDVSPYTAEEVQAMLAHGPQRAWLAFGQDQVVGFVTAFSTAGLHGPCWEIDLLAVHPDWTGQGLATRLIQAAAAHRVAGVPRTRAPALLSRAVVATNNPGSARAFMHAGFRRAGRCKLLIFRPGEQSSHPWLALNLTVREVGREELAPLTVIASEAKHRHEYSRWHSPSAELEIASGAARPCNDDSATNLPGQQPTQEPTLLLAEGGDQQLGYAELLEVQTLLYRGIWIESLVASRQIAQAALVHEAVKRAIAADLDEVGMMVPERDHAVQETLRAADFRSLGSFDWFAAMLPLPGLASGQEEP